MKFLITGAFLCVALATLATAEEWSWGKDKTAKDQAKPSAADSESATNRESKSIDSYSEINDDSGSNSNEGGASVAGSSVNGSDTQGRHAIRDRLCGLGLMEVFKTTILYLPM